jgi:hypothetical protein
LSLSLPVSWPPPIPTATNTVTATIPTAMSLPHFHTSERSSRVSSQRMVQTHRKTAVTLGFSCLLQGSSPVCLVVGGRSTAGGSLALSLSFS